ncbi:MAG: TraR/DksA family transcriptional regulator, partial [Ilumatobacteraceae bacterium]
ARQAGPGEEGARQEGARQEGARKEGARQEGAGEEGPGEEGARQEGTGKKAPAKKVPAKQTPATKVPAATSARQPTKPIPSKPTPPAPAAAVGAAPKSGSKKPAAVVVKKPPVAPAIPKPVVKGVTKDGISYTKDFDAKFLTARRDQLLSEREFLVGQATRLEDEAHQLTEEHEMGDVEFGDEGGEGDTLVVERERDLVLSAQARQTVEEIDLALKRLTTGDYGYSIESGRPIPRERLEALPWSTVLVEEKVGGFGRR